MGEHAHIWELDWQQSEYSINRYRCECGAWGYRIYSRGREVTLGPLKVYKHGYQSHAEPTALSRNDPEMYRLTPNRLTERKKDWPWS